MIYITYYKSDGEITTPCIVSETEQNFNDIFGNRAEEMTLIYDSLSFSLGNIDQENIFLNDIIRGNYKVNLETKTLEKKQLGELNIKYN
ncbi:hypothetical protein JHL18_01570 [Clostridium sp. YIM B02505]|uniref:Nonstructural protein n=1 Tax=Clostridium yunnanense TaxID=2800325 RepID=A0ABS1EIZ1_9CLOT|nr:hypothetical protein [Clostridium yunnanense]MBK1809334.1 hypothetical protein [Clostridium yunnanense]